MAPHEVVVLVLNDVVAFDLGVPTQIFGAARDGDDRRLYRVRVCTAEVANRAARRSVVPPWRDGGQSQFIERPMPDPTGTSPASARRRRCASTCTRPWASPRPPTAARSAGTRQRSSPGTAGG